MNTKIEILFRIHRHSYMNAGSSVWLVERKQPTNQLALDLMRRSVFSFSLLFELNLAQSVARLLSFASKLRKMNALELHPLWFIAPKHESLSWEWSEAFAHNFKVCSWIWGLIQFACFLLAHFVSTVPDCFRNENRVLEFERVPAAWDICTDLRSYF